MATIEKPTNRLASTPEVAAPRATGSYAEAPAPEGTGWLLFSAIVLGFAGMFALLEGLLAIGGSRIYVGTTTFVFSDLNTWGWIMTILGALTMLAAFAIFAGSEFARWFGITMAGLNALGQLFFVHANPWWAAAIFAVDVLVIYGLAVYGGSRLRTD